jgi:formate/nitrite transporter FocA (FNT family)
MSNEKRGKNLTETIDAEIAGSVDVLYLVNLGVVSWSTYFISFMLPTLIGNIIGGVSLIAALNFAQVASEVIKDS